MQQSHFFSVLQLIWCLFHLFPLVKSSGDKTVFYLLAPISLLLFSSLASSSLLSLLLAVIQNSSRYCLDAELISAYRTSGKIIFSLTSLRGMRGRPQLKHSVQASYFGLYSCSKQYFFFLFYPFSFFFLFKAILFFCQEVRGKSEVLEDYLFIFKVIVKELCGDVTTSAINHFLAGAKIKVVRYVLAFSKKAFNLRVKASFSCCLLCTFLYSF